MEDQELKVGDTVRLKSGGPLMTVTKADVLVRCTWFDDSGACQSHAFHKQSLDITKA